MLEINDLKIVHSGYGRVSFGLASRQTQLTHVREATTMYQMMGGDESQSKQNRIICMTGDPLRNLLYNYPTPKVPICNHLGSRTHTRAKLPYPGDYSGS